MDTWCVRAVGNYIYSLQTNGWYDRKHHPVGTVREQTRILARAPCKRCSKCGGKYWFKYPPLLGLGFEPMRQNTSSSFTPQNAECCENVAPYTHTHIWSSVMAVNIRSTCRPHSGAAIGWADFGQVVCMGREPPPSLPCTRTSEAYKMDYVLYLFTSKFMFTPYAIRKPNSALQKPCRQR